MSKKYRPSMSRTVPSWVEVPYIGGSSKLKAELNGPGSFSEKSALV